jgi:hypothetical protein
VGRHSKPVPYPGGVPDPDAPPKRVLTGGAQHMSELADNANRRVFDRMAREAEQE